MLFLHVDFDRSFDFLLKMNCRSPSLTKLLKNTRFMRYFFLTIVWIAIFTGSSWAQTSNATLQGTVRDANGQVLEMVNVSIQNYPIGTTSNRKGDYLLRIPTGREVSVVFSIIGYKPHVEKITAQSEDFIKRDVVLEAVSEEIDEVVISRQAQSSGNMTTLNPRNADVLPGIGVATIDNILKTLPGVTSANELSSQYSVRGGSFDENLVYVNDIEIYRPSLIRSGQQEGLSFVNNDMVSAIEFSAGGFDAKYGDKMSSVLNIRYNRPTEFRSSVMASLLGATAHVENISKNPRFTYNMGLRYKSYRYLLGALEEKGEYNPLFFDVQGYFTYALTSKSELGLLSSASLNRYRYYPTTRNTKMGTWNNAYSLSVSFEGGEIDGYNTYTNALFYNYQPHKNLYLKFIASAYTTSESETFDILGYYFFNELGRDQQSENYGDSVKNVGYGMYHEHGRNAFYAEVATLSHKGNYKEGAHHLQWGLTAKREWIFDSMSEWTLRDSSGYSLPYSDSEIVFYHNLRTKYKHVQSRYEAYFQESFSVPTRWGNLLFTGGLRGQYWTFDNDLTLSPRFSASLKEANRDVIYRFSAGWYHQPPFYRELKNLSGEINPDIQTPRSFHTVAGLDFGFMGWGRPFRLTSELYYKALRNLIPYQIENVRIRYLSNLTSDGYAMGADLKINGEFVSGTQSWASISLMDTREDIVGDGKGYIPRPSDQRFKFSFFFQDYLPGIPEFQMNLSGHYITGTPFGMPRTERWQQTARMQAYKRIDVGVTRSLVVNGENLTKWKLFDGLKTCSIGVEVFNMLDFDNTSSYFFVADFDNVYRAVPNRLTGRMFNVKLTAGF